MNELSRVFSEQFRPFPSYLRKARPRDGQTNAWTDGWWDGRMEGWMDRQMDGLMDKQSLI